MILIEVTAAIDSDGTLRTFYVGTDGFQTAPTDAPANQAFDAALAEPGNIGLTAFSDARTSGASKLEVGEVVIRNLDGDYDAWTDYSFDGRRIVIRRGEGGAYPAGFKTIFTGTMESVTVTLDSVVIATKDKSAILDLPVLTTKYAGTNVGPVGLEGTSDDLKGSVKPRVYGRVFNIAPPCVNTSKLTFQVSDRAVGEIGDVYDRGVALTFGVDHATSSALTAATIGSGLYHTCLAEGLFRLGSTPTGIITADAASSTDDADMVVSAVLADLAIDASIAPADLDSQEFAELNADAPYVVGLYLDDESTTFREAMDLVAGSVGAWYGFDAAGVFRCAQLKAPGEPVAEIIEADVLDGFERGVADDNGIPAWRVTVRYRRFWTTQDTDLAGSVAADRRAALAEEYRSITVEDETVKHQWLKATEITVDTLLVNAADAQAEANRLLALRRVRRDLFEVPLDVDALNDCVFDLMKTVELTHSRFGLAGGRAFRVLSRRLELGFRAIRLKLWG